MKLKTDTYLLKPVSFEVRNREKGHNMFEAPSVYEAYIAIKILSGMSVTGISKVCSVRVQ